MNDNIATGAKIELARRFFYDYCSLKYSKHYNDNRPYLKTMCENIQYFVEESSKRFLILTVPPRHYKSFTGTNLAEWDFGKRPHHKIITGSYNETLSTTFARKVRNTIAEQKTIGGPLVYTDIFPNTHIQYGQASASLWALDGDGQDSYLATSPTGTATGFGANIGIIDDIIKNATEAYNERVLDEHWSWFTNTMMQRTEGEDWKFIIIMTRWATGDLAGRILDAFPDKTEEISFSAIQDDGSMLCDAVLTKESYLDKTQEMNPDIVEANYNQKPIDVKGKLFGEFTTYDSLPDGKHRKFNYTDTADKGTDYLCSVDYFEHGDDVYITDVVMSDDGMEITEPLVADMLFNDRVIRAVIESNNGGRGFARNVERELKEKYNSTKCVIDWQTQTKNKEARILASSAWVNKHIIMPYNWKNKWPEFYGQINKYQRKGKNAHDDAPDVLAAIYETVANATELDLPSGDDAI